MQRLRVRVLHLLVDSPHIRRPICQGAGEVATEDEVVLLFPDPFTLDVVNLELYIRGHPG